MDDTIIKYFNDGSSYFEIAELLNHVHDFQISLSTLKRWLKDNSLKRRPLAAVRSSNEEIRQAVQEELNGIWYGRVHRALVRKGLVVRKHDVRLLVKELDPEGVMIRKRRHLCRRKYSNPGPNFRWHINGYNKLKYFGFSIRGCIDGFSRKILWLHVYASNKDPNVTAKLYLDTVSEFGGVPKNISTDDGTEHSIIELMHIYLSSLDSNHEESDVLKSFKIISSPKNQQIEAYSSFLRRDKIEWWKEFFEDLNDLGFFDSSDEAVLECMRFCLMTLIREDLSLIKSDWNVHIISRSRNGGPRGRTDTMYNLPHCYNSENYLTEVDNEETSALYVALDSPQEDYSEFFDDFAKKIVLALPAYLKPFSYTCIC